MERKRSHGGMGTGVAEVEKGDEVYKSGEKKRKCVDWGRVMPRCIGEEGYDLAECIAQIVTWRESMDSGVIKRKYVIQPKEVGEWYGQREDSWGVHVQDVLRKVVEEGVGGKRYKGYKYIGGMEGMRGAIMVEGPIIVVMNVREGGEGEERFWEGGDVVGRHSVVGIGYDDERGVIRVLDVSDGREKEVEYGEVGEIISAWVLEGE